MADEDDTLNVDDAETPEAEEATEAGAADGDEADLNSALDEFGDGEEPEWPMEDLEASRTGGELLSADEPEEPIHTAGDLEAVYDVPVQLSAVLGRASMQVNQLLKLGRGAVVELDRKVGEAIDIYVNNRLVARGEVVVVEERLGVTMTEIIKSDRIN